MLRIITKRFIKRILKKGRLTEARQRFESGAANPRDLNFDSATCWSLICEEVLDTDHKPEEYDTIYAELIRRGLSNDEIDDMREFAWKTVGWLNYDLMLWEWGSLDEKDIEEALKSQLEKRKIKRDVFEDGLRKIQYSLKTYPPIPTDRSR